ncbi:unnamed protein product [Blepharisma stoltei]|uniref:cGMP-dependent protein kinase interacting domain-containing protein n=1 Tax=Blepharisma stoltei TaxID=1481888 RepID=A0AAU9IGJ7_9CILI|nr:unnamed protein product [Blepharisma stoltei]
MESIFSKPPASPSHHYATLLQKKEKGNKSSEYFSRAITPTAHLYTANGLAKGHRRTVSIPQNHNSDTTNPNCNRPESSESYEYGNSDDINLIKEELKNVKEENFSLKSRIKDLEKQLEDEKIRVKILESRLRM